MSEWISVNDKLPKQDNFDIFVYSPTKGVCHGVAWDYGNVFMDDECQFIISDVTHWMEMKFPKPPEE